MRVLILFFKKRIFFRILEYTLAIPILFPFIFFLKNLFEGLIVVQIFNDLIFA